MNNIQFRKRLQIEQSPKQARPTEERSTSLDRRSENIRVLPVIIAELKLGDIEWHIFPAHFVEGADHAALEDRPEALDGLSVDCADDILPSRVINSYVRVILVERVVAGILIGAKQADPVRDRFADEGGESFGIDIRDHARNDVTLAADRADDWRLAGPDAACSTAAAAFIPMPVFGQAADESFIDFDNAAELIDVLHESGSDLMAHEPSGPVRAEAHITIDLQSAHALFAGKHEMDDAEPLPQRLVCILENRSSDMRKAVVSGARGALVAQPIPWHCAVPFDLRIATPRARYAFRPAASGKIGATGVFVREGSFPLDDGHLVDWLGLLCAGHIGSPSRQEPI
jgi:hypothetical protein